MGPRDRRLRLKTARVVLITFENCPRRDYFDITPWRERDERSITTDPTIDGTPSGKHKLRDRSNTVILYIITIIVGNNNNTAALADP